MDVGDAFLRAVEVEAPNGTAVDRTVEDSKDIEALSAARAF